MQNMNRDAYVGEPGQIRLLFDSLGTFVMMKVCDLLPYFLFFSIGWYFFNDYDYL